ncbi:MAG: glycosyltransferase [candidate division Zixibacteria bacterium]|nr:glycosyltransferase [candidate division Zixibacteria bacterium]
MKVCFHSRPNLSSVLGGDSIQVFKTKEYLEKAGISVDIDLNPTPESDNYDILHLFNLIRPQGMLQRAREAKKDGKKVALSTIFVDYSEYEKQARSGFMKHIFRLLPTYHLEYLKAVARTIKSRSINRSDIEYFVSGHLRSQRELLSYVDILLPNSRSEYNRVCAMFPEANKIPHVVVPNAMDAHLFNGHPIDIASEFRKYQDCILCAARIEGRKNQLNLVRAVNELPYKLVLVGEPAPNHVHYFEQIKREAGDNIHLIGKIAHEELPILYKLAKVHCLVSWAETTGLSSLEAAAMGCNLVITDKGDTRDYFGDLAFYCEPDSVESIRNAVKEAYESPVNPALKERVLTEFVWEKTAEKTIEGYKTILN